MQKALANDIQGLIFKSYNMAVFKILFVAGFLSIFNLSIALPGEVLNVKDFGAKGDGVSDDYQALLAAAKACNRKDKCELHFPKGIYYISEYHTKDNKIPDILFDKRDGLIISGEEGAVISVNGKFKRSRDYQKGRRNLWYSYFNAITPFVFRDCKNLTIRGLEISGNVNDMLRDSGVVESSAHLISLKDCKNVLIENVDVHHAQTDGIYVFGDNSENITMRNVTSSYNARQGLSIINLQGGNFYNCAFKNTGFSEGKYGFHMPGAGVDIEPKGKTSNITFENCEFENNRGGQFLCTSPSFTSNINLRNCTLSAKNSNSKYQMILAAKNVVIDNCSIDCGNGNIWPTWKTLPGSVVTIKNCTIKGSQNGIRSISGDDRDKVTITDNAFEFTGTTMKSYFPYLRTKNLIFDGNKIFIPAKSMSSTGPSSLVQNGLSAKGNKFYSDDKTIKPRVSYDGTKERKDNQ